MSVSKTVMILQKHTTNFIVRNYVRDCDIFRIMRLSTQIKKNNNHINRFGKDANTQETSVYFGLYDNVMFCCEKYLALRENSEENNVIARFHIIDKIQTAITTLVYALPAIHNEVFFIFNLVILAMIWLTN